MAYRIGALLGAAALCALSFSPASADPTGLWHCQFVNQPANQSPLETWTYQFDLQLSPNGQGFAQGSYYALSAGYNEPFQAQGQWQETPDHQALQFQATVMKQSGGTPFLLIMRYAGQGQMSSRTPMPLGTILQACQR